MLFSPPVLLVLTVTEGGEEPVSKLSLVLPEKEVLGFPEGFARYHLKTVSKNLTRSWSGVISKSKTGINWN